jgi:hypothetical protein
MYSEKSPSNDGESRKKSSDSDDPESDIYELMIFSWPRKPSPADDGIFVIIFLQKQQRKTHKFLENAAILLAIFIKCKNTIYETRKKVGN